MMHWNSFTHFSVCVTSHPQATSISFHAVLFCLFNLYIQTFFLTTSIPQVLHISSHTNAQFLYSSKSFICPFHRSNWPFFTALTINLSCLSNPLFIPPSTYPNYPCVHWSVQLSIYQSVHPLIHTSFWSKPPHPSIYPSIQSLIHPCILSYVTIHSSI